MSTWSIAQARQLLNRWSTDRIPLCAVFSDPNVSLIATGIIDSAAGDVLSFVMRESAGFSMPFANADFDYSEPKDGPAPIESSPSDKFVSVLQMRVRDTWVCLLYELWNEQGSTSRQ